MLYMTSPCGKLKIIILETENLEELKKGRPAKSPDLSVLIAWTPDSKWLSEQILQSDGDAETIGKLIDEAAKRPQAPLRPHHPPEVHHRKGNEDAEAKATTSPDIDGAIL